MTNSQTQTSAEGGRNVCLSLDLRHKTKLSLGLRNCFFLGRVSCWKLTSSYSKTQALPRNVSRAPRCEWECVLVGLQALLQASQLWLRAAVRSPLCHWTCPTFTHYLIQTCELFISTLHGASVGAQKSCPQTIRVYFFLQIKSNNSLLSLSDSDVCSSTEEPV